MVKKFMLAVTLLGSLCIPVFAAQDDAKIEMYNLLNTPQPEIEQYFNNVLELGVLTLGVAPIGYMLDADGTGVESRDCAQIYIGSLRSYLDKMIINSGQVLNLRFQCQAFKGISNIECVINRDNMVQQILYSEDFQVESDIIYPKFSGVIKVALYGGTGQRKSIYTITAKVRDTTGKIIAAKPVKIEINGYNDEIKKGVKIVKEKIYEAQRKKK